MTIIENLGRGCTIYFGKTAQALKQTEIIYTLTTRLDLAQLHTEKKKDKDARGGMIKKRPM
ncbi:MAG: hypothetical protein HQ565_07605 [Bacteroidetes bacterium]|nr:hypothetical protein [Bacteroidota bacterium]